MTKEYKVKVTGEENSRIILTGDVEKQTEIEAWIADHTDSIVDGVTVLTEDFPEVEEDISQIANFLEDNQD